MLLSPRAGPTCAHRCSVLARSRQTRIVRLSCEDGNRRAGTCIWSFQVYISGAISPLKAVRCVPGPRFHCFTLLNSLHSEFRPPSAEFIFMPTLQTR